MKIAGLIKQSYIDYPGKMAAVVFTQGCNFRCGYCHNPSLVLPRLFHHNKLVAVSDVLIHLENRKDWLDGVVITGGEPTIHGDLPDFLRQIKSLGYLVKLDTNGSNPLMLEKVIKENLVDFIAMDIKTLLQEELYAKSIGLKNASKITDKILASVIMLKKATMAVEFRTTYIPDIHNEAMVALIKNFIGNDKMYKINEYRGDITIAHYN